MVFHVTCYVMSTVAHNGATQYSERKRPSIQAPVLVLLNTAIES